ncbi:MAG TPA: outer membrane beta-barrel protein [Chitinophagaceae bacterium]|nr:outer membrane beta-barrel protein [Chitinophagaceae bacterium]
MQKILLLLVLVIAGTAAFAQKVTIKGRVYDSAVNKGLAYATVSLVKAKDSTLVTFARADSSGNFTLNNVNKGAYLISTSYVGYAPVWHALPALPAQGVFNAGDIYMTDVTKLQDVSITAKRPPVEINNDTLEFNTENFKTQPNAVVEDMLKKMPGVTVDNDGTIKVNGQTVKRILVNGKEFFTGDVKMATKNLNADAVDKVQVFDKKSDQAAFTGVDDGNSEKTINLKLKKDRNNALFGKVTAGAGSNEKYDAQANINKFKGDEQMSFLGMANNTNRQGFSLMDVLNFTGELSRGMRNGGGGVRIISNDNGSGGNGLPVTGLGQNQQGVATTYAGGVNYNNTWNQGKTDLSTNYTASNIHLLTDKEDNMQNLLPGYIYNRLDSSHTINDATQHRFNVVLDQKVDSSFSFKLTPSLTIQHSNKIQQESYTSQTPAKLVLNDGFSNTASAADALNFTTDLLVRKRLHKKGRTISGDFNFAYNHSKLNGTQLSDNNFYNNGNVIDSNINQQNSRDAITRSFGGNITYTEPVGKRSLLAFNGFYNVNSGQSNKQTYNYSTSSGKHDLFDSALSNNFSSNYTYTGGGVNFRSNMHKVNLTLGTSLQSATLKAVNNTYNQTIRQQFIDVLPNAMLQYQFTQTKNLRLEYNTSTIQPSVAQLQPVPDVSDPLNVTVGNPALKRSYNQSLSLNYIAASFAKRNNLFIMFNYNATANAIAQSDSVTNYGARVSKPVNAQGVHNVFANVEYGFPLKKLSARLEVGSSFNAGNNVSFVNGARNTITFYTWGPNVSLDYSRDDKIDIELSASFNINTSKYSLQPLLNTNYMRQRYGIDMTNYLPWGISLHNGFTYTLNTGRTGGYNTDIPLWNASIAKAFLKNSRGELKLSVADLLNKNTGITRNSSQGYIIDEKYNVLRRYFLLSFTYSLNKSGLKSKGGPNIKIRTIGE